MALANARGWVLVFRINHVALSRERKGAQESFFSTAPSPQHFRHSTF